MPPTVTIPKKEYDRIKKIEEEMKKEVEESIDRSIEDLKAGRVIRYA